MICKRCLKKTNTTIISMFNMEVICMECKDKEKSHHKYNEARAAEYYEIIKKNYNFAGIGLPKELENR